MVHRRGRLDRRQHHQLPGIQETQHLRKSQPLRWLDLQPDNDDDNQAYTTTTEDPNIFSCKYLTD